MQLKIIGLSISSLLNRVEAPNIFSMVNKPSYGQVANRASVRSSGFAQALWNTGQAIALALFAAVLPACTPSPGPKAGTTISEVANEPNADLIGKTVTVSGEVEKIIGSKAFTIEGDRLFNDPEVLVVSATETPIIKDILVQVTGTVRQFFVSEIESKFDLDLPQEFEVEFRNKPVLIATAVALTPRPGEIAEEPSVFMGKTVTVSSKVAKVIGPNAFTLDDKEFIGGKELLVVGAIPVAGSIDEGETVQVTGLVRKFVTAEIERDFDFDLQPELEVEYEGKPVAIAQSIQKVE